MSKRRRNSDLLTSGHALSCMRTGSRLVCMHGGRHRWFVLPGGAVSDQVAAEIREHPSVVGGNDGLFPQHDQTWRMRTFAHSA
jgi:hypothetical protein